MVEIIAGGLIFALLFYLEDLARKSMLFPLFFFLPTLFHELAHFLVAFLLGGKPSFPNLIPRRERDTWILGSVKFYATPLNAFPSAMAPLLLLPASVMAYTNLPFGIREVVAWIFLKGAVPSPQDFRVAFSYFISALLWILAAAVMLQLPGEKLLPLINHYAKELFSLIDL